MRPLMVALAALAVLIGPAAGAAQTPAPPAASDEDRVVGPAEAQNDFTQMYETLQRAHYDVFAMTPRAELDRAFSETRKALDRPLTLLELKVRFQTFLAQVRMGHTRIDFPQGKWRQYQDQGGKLFPLRIRVVGERAHVTENLSGSNQFAVGDELIALNGRPAREVLDGVSRHISAETRYMSDSLLEFMLARALWLEFGPLETFDIQVRRSDGRVVRARIPARTRKELDAAAATAPKLLELDDERRAKVLPGGIGYLRPGPFYNTAAQSEADMYQVADFRAFIDTSFNDFLAAGVDTVLIDIRNNPGGDNSFSDLMIAWFADRPFRFFSQFKVKVSPEAIAANKARIDHDLVAAGEGSQMYARLYARSAVGSVAESELPYAQPRPEPRFKGKVYALIDRHTYSNAVNVAAIIQDYRFGTILGEPTSDMATTYGAMEKFQLPRTGIQVGFPKAFIVRPNGERRVHGVTPDVAIKGPVIETPADEVLTAALAVIAERRPKVGGD